MTDKTTQSAGCLSHLTAELGTISDKQLLDNIEKSFLYGSSSMIPAGLLMANNNYDYRPRFARARAKLLRHSA